MKSVRLVIPDLFLPNGFAAEVCAGLSLPALQKLLGRGHSEMLDPVSLEGMLCGLFGVQDAGDAPVAAISAAFDGLAAGYWLRADPVNLNLQRDRLLLAGVRVASEEAATLCASLNTHFAGQGIEFFAPHPQRWYVRLGGLPRIRTTPLSQAIGGDVRAALPAGEDASRWHRLFNEIQMLLHAHPLNEIREVRGETIVNSVWFWGGGDTSTPFRKNFDCVSSDDVLAEMFAVAADIPFSRWPEQWRDDACDGRQLLVWTGLRSALQHNDLSAWRTALQDFENGYARPILQALRSGRIAQLQLDVAGRDGIRSTRLTRRDTWAFWRRTRRLAEYSLT